MLFYANDCLKTKVKGRWRGNFVRTGKRQVW